METRLKKGLLDRVQIKTQKCCHSESIQYTAMIFCVIIYSRECQIKRTRNQSNVYNVGIEQPNNHQSEKQLFIELQ
jgi:late competence protein required for DNA uptake (superfamily II DNA/RNA helicase)